MPLAHKREHNSESLIMKLIRLRSVLQIAVLAVAFSTAARASDDKAAATVSKHDLQAKVDYCETCHGLSGRGFIGFHPIPRLAGQQVEYIENELKGFVEHTRQNKESPSSTNIMFNVGHVLSPAMINALATHFHDLNPKPLGARQRKSWQRERRFLTREFQALMFRLAPPATVQTLKATGRFLG